MKRAPFKPRIKPLAGILRTAKLPSVKPTSISRPKIRKSLKSSQRSVTKADRELWHRIAGLGCCACAIDGNENPFVSIHHVDGRTKAGCHALVLPLCAEHHQQDDTDKLQRIAIHPNKARFEQKYGTQAELLALVMERLGK